MTWEPSDELVEKCWIEQKGGSEGDVKAVLKAAVESGELVPKSWLERVLDLDGDDWGSSQIGQPVYTFIEPAQPNDGGES